MDLWVHIRVVDTRPGTRAAPTQPAVLERKLTQATSAGLLDRAMVYALLQLLLLPGLVETLQQARDQQHTHPREQKARTSTLVVHCRSRSNCTAELQHALDTPDAVDIIVPQGAPIQVDPIFIRKGNRRLILQTGVELVAISMSPAYQRMDASLLSVLHVANVKVVAEGATLRMHKLEYLPPHYKKGEWRATLNIREVSNLTVRGGTYVDAGGDGVFVESSLGPIVLDGLTTKGAWRNGLSVISAGGGLQVKSCTFSDTNGTAPQCGVDIEPDSSDDLLRGVVFSDVQLLGNKRCGFTLSPTRMINSATPIDLVVDGMIIRDVPGSAYQWGRAPDHNVGGVGLKLLNSYNLTGSIYILNASISQTYASALYLDNWPNGYISLVFDGLHISNVTHGIGETRWHGVQPLGPVFGGGPVSPVVVMPASCENSCDMRKRCQDCDPTLSSGGLIFRNATIEDSTNRSWLSRMWTGMHGHESPPSLTNLSGLIEVKNRCGCMPAEVGPSATDIHLNTICKEASTDGDRVERE